MSRHNDLLVQLDQALTQQDPAATSQARTISLMDLLYGEVIYLSDGGYTRVCWSCAIMRLCLADSTPRSLPRWGEAKPLRDELEELLQEAMTNQY